MRLCRFENNGSVQVGFYNEDSVLPLLPVAQECLVAIEESDSLLPFLPGGEQRAAVVELEQKIGDLSSSAKADLTVPIDVVQLLVPNANPTKLLLLAGNYAKHIEEGGEKAKERESTFPYVFMKPPLTTLNNPGGAIKIPAVSPDHVDWECELGVIIGKQCKGVSEAEALDYVAGYTIVNDISDRKYQPNPGRTERPRDKFFDWLHGKWHDTFCPMGPAVVPADELNDPQTLKLQLRVNGNVEQDSSTAEMVFPVAAVVEFISSWVTLEPGDIISTGTPAGVGMAKDRFLKAGDVVEAEIESIGVLRNPVE